MRVPLLLAMTLAGCVGPATERPREPALAAPETVRTSSAPPRAQPVTPGGPFDFSAPAPLPDAGVQAVPWRPGQQPGTEKGLWPVVQE